MGADPAITIDEVQNLTWAEAMALARIQGEVTPGHRPTTDDLRADLGHLVSAGGRAWIMRLEQAVAGYASVMPVPGLPGVVELDGFIAQVFRGQGLGGRLLDAIIDQLAGGAVRQLSYATRDRESVAARLLLGNGFTIEHEEQLLVLEHLVALPAAELDEGFSLRTYTRSQAIAHFRRLYPAAFADLAWYQPYEDAREVDRDLADADDLLFLVEGRRPVGFLWLRWPDVSVAAIEPVGLLPAYRGRGLGRQLMLAGVRRAAQQGAARVSVGAWRTNAAALALYRQLGFRPAGRLFYLAYDL